MDLWNTIIITPFTNILLFIYTIAGQNFGVAIILFTVLIKLVTHPLMVSQIKGGAAMQELQSNPRYKEIQEKYKGDKEKLAQEQAALLKELGVNPFGSCLPLLIQFPVIIGLYQSLYKAMANTPFDMLAMTRHLYPFMDISKIVPINNQFLWMDLSQPDKLVVSFLPFAIPIMAILVMGTTYVQSKLITPGATNSKDQTAMMGNMMNLYMPFMMGYMGLTLASGLSLYFVVSNVFGIAQYAAMGKANWNNVLPKRKAPVEVIPEKKPAKLSRGKK